jgi:choline transporter-like protein 2/4/5
MMVLYCCISRAVGNMVFTLFWPIIPWVLQVILFVYWGASAVCLASMGRVIRANNTNESIDCDINTTAGRLCHFVKYGGDE